MSLRALTSPGGIVASFFKGLNNIHLSNVATSQKTSQSLLTNLSVSFGQLQQCRGYNNRWSSEDDRNRALVCAVAPERRILEGIQVAKHVLPQELRDKAKKDLRDWSKFPKRSCPEGLVNRCTITGRTRGIVRPWRMSRFVWREAADFGKLCGVKRAMWGVNNMKNRRCYGF